MNEYSEGERRAFKRFRFQQPVEFQTKEPSQTIGSLSGDISEGGIRLKLFKFLPINSQITLSVYLDSLQVVECHGRVVWIEEEPASERFEVGIEFESTSQSNVSKQSIRKFLEVTQPKLLADNK